MENYSSINFLKEVLKNKPTSWLSKTTHRLDIYDEKLAKTEFLEQFEDLYKNMNSNTAALNELPTAYDYIRLGHPLSCVLEWALAHFYKTKPENIISFSSQTIAILAILRKNLLDHKNTQIVYTEELPDFFDAEVIKRIYGYQFELKHVEKLSDIPFFKGSTIVVTQNDAIGINPLNANTDFFINIYGQLGSILIVNGEQNEHYISDIQHVRRRETIAMTPVNCNAVLEAFVNNTRFTVPPGHLKTNKEIVLDSIVKITGANTKPLVGSSGLSIQYAIMMGLIDDAQENHKGKANFNKRFYNWKC